MGIAHSELLCILFRFYVEFFNVSGILLLVVVINNLDKNIHPLRQVLLAFCALVIIAGIGYSAFDSIGSWLLVISFPFLHKGKITFLSIWTILSNKFLLKQNAALKIASATAGVLVGLALLVVVFLIFRLLRRKDVIMRCSRCDILTSASFFHPC